MYRKYLQLLIGTLKRVMTSLILCINMCVKLNYHGQSIHALGIKYPISFRYSKFLKNTKYINFNLILKESNKLDFLTKVEMI